MSKTQKINATKSVTVSLPPELLEEIDSLAEMDGRSRSNWIARKLSEICDVELPTEYAPRATKTAFDDEVAKKAIAKTVIKAKNAVS